MTDTLLLDVIFDISGDICNIRHRIPGYTGSYPKYTTLLKSRVNIIQILKQFKVVREEFSVLSDILSCIENTDTLEHRTFQLTDRQGAFTNKYLVTGLDTAIQITNPITIHVSPGCISFSINILPQTKLSYIRHELINPLHTIKMTSELIKDASSRRSSNSDVNRLGDLISSKVDESLSLLDGLLAMGSPRLDPVNISSFIQYITEYINTVNQSYSQTIKPIIIWPHLSTSGHRNSLFSIGNSCKQSVNAVDGTVYVNTCYIKVILDNVFKNIFGHLDSRIAGREFRDFTVRIDSIASTQISNIYIIVRNCINHASIGARPLTGRQPFVFSHHTMPSKQLAIYHLDSSHVSATAMSNDKTTTELGGLGGSGIRLIDELCKKMNIQWTLEDSTDPTDPVISFTLKIPISHGANLKNVHAFVPMCV